MPVYTAVTANGKPAVLLNITRQPSGNTVAVANAVAAEMAQLQTKLPPGVQLEPSTTSRSWCARAFAACATRFSSAWCWPASSCFSSCATGRSSLVAGLVIPVTVAVTILFLWITGQSFNLMTLGGLAAAIGLVIDDAIVVVENIVLHRDAGESRVRGGPQGAARDQPAAGRFHHHAGGRLSSAGRGHRGHGQLLPRACRHHDGCVADFPAAGAYVDSGALRLGLLRESSRGRRREHAKRSAEHRGNRRAGPRAAVARACAGLVIDAAARCWLAVCAGADRWRTYFGYQEPGLRPAAGDG